MSAQARPTVSVLVPAYNAEPYLPTCLESVLNQTYGEVEVIVVDDGSTDATPRLARRYESRGVRVISQANAGPNAARNAAFDASRGEYLQYLDADDVLHQEKIERQVRRLSTSEPTAMASGAWARFTSSTDEAVFRPEAVWADFAPVDWLTTSWGGGGMMHTAGWLIPRRVALAAGPWNAARRWAANDDADFFTRALLASSECVFCPDAKSYYRATPGSQSTLQARRSQEAALAVVLDTGEALLRREDSARTRSAYADNLQRFVYLTYPSSPDLVVQAETRIQELGGARLGPEGALGPVSLLAARCLGWKRAKRLRQAFAR